MSDPGARELKEALARQAATAEILEIIASSPTDTQPVFDAIVQSGLRLFADAACSVALPDGDQIRAVAVAEADSERAEAWRNRFPFPLQRDYMHGLAILDAKIIDIPDVANAPPEFLAGAQNFLASGYRAITIMPMMRGDAAIGALSVVRQTAGPLSGEQLAVLKTFAAQAVIAIENTRLLNELRQRTRDLSESLEQQTATSEVLRVISSSPIDLGPIFDAIVKNAPRLCDATNVSLHRVEGDVMRQVASYGAIDTLKRGEARPITPGSLSGRAIIGRNAVHVDDALAVAEAEFPDSKEAIEREGVRTALAVPLMLGETPLGAIVIRRTEVRPFSEKQTSLLKTFADQAVIAIENARLFNELRQRTDSLSESLGQQTAISDILRVIANSPGEVKPVFDSVAKHAAHICEAPFVGIVVVKDGMMRPAVNVGGLGGLPQGEMVPIDRTTVMGRSICDKQPVHVADPLAAEHDFPHGRELALRLGHRTILSVPLIHEGHALGAIVVRRTQVRPFEDKHVALLKTFADQAAIAIENARLLKELRQRTDDLSESLEQQTATSEVLRIIASSPADTQPVFDAIVQSGLKLFPGALISVALRYGDKINAAAVAAPDPVRVEAWRRTINSRTPLARDYMHGAALLDRRIVDIPDVTDAPAEFDAGAKNFLTSGNRAITIMPMMRGGEAIGLLSVVRPVAGPLSDKQLALLKTFAAQAVIAIENTRLLTEVRQQADQLEAQSRELRTLNQQLEQRVDEQVGEIERMSRLRRFLPPQVADLIVSSGSEKQLESHRREITALFCDLRGFTGFSETSDPEDVMALLREYHKAIGEIIFRHGGTLERFAGDGVMVIFGDPVPLPNPALSAVQMALEMRAAIGTLIDKWSRLGHELGFGIGISHGFATLGTIGFEGRFDYAAIGTVSNVASRLCDEAQPGQILVSPRVLLAVENAVSVEPVAEMTLKGIRRPMLVHNVVGVTTGTPVTG